MGKRKPEPLPDQFKLGRPRGRGGRKAGELTERMRHALPIMSTCTTPREGIRELVDKGIVSALTYHRDWSKDVSWITALNREREKFLGSVKRRAQAVAIHGVERAVLTIREIADGTIDAKPGQLAACIEVCRLAGVDKLTDAEPGVNVFALVRQSIREQVTGSEETEVINFGVPVDAAEADPVDVDDISLSSDPASDSNNPPSEDELEEADAAGEQG